MQDILYTNGYRRRVTKKRLFRKAKLSAIKHPFASDFSFQSSVRKKEARNTVFLPLTPDDFYNKIYQRAVKERQGAVDRLKRLDTADEMYYLNATYLLGICKRAPELFKSSKLQEKRGLIKLVLSNSYLDGKKVCYEAKKPFNTILEYAKTNKWGW